jgi:hypothetical protein
MNDEAMRKYPMTILVIVHELPLVDVPFRGKFPGYHPLGTLLLVLAPPLAPGLPLHERDVPLHVVLLMTWLRTFLGLSPDLEEGTERQKHRDVVLEPLPEGFATCSIA